jgi:hypothetical protein
MMRTQWSRIGTSGFRPSTLPDLGAIHRWRAETPPDFGPGVFVRWGQTTRQNPRAEERRESAKTLHHSRLPV